MKYTIKIIYIALLLLWQFPLLAQQQTVQIFTPENFIQLVKQYHPVAKQANILVNKAEADLLSARGGFDPVLDVDASRKTFDGKNYYNYFNPELKIPTPIGVDIKTGIENNGGQYLTSEASKGNSSYVGVEVALAKGLLIDKRRAMLQQAKLFKSQSEQDKQKIINDLLFDAYSDYWQWTSAYQLYSIYSRFVLVANNRLRLVRIAFVNGDRAVMDTVEAFTQVQNYQLQQADALLKLNNANLQLSNYLWQQNDSAYLLPPQYVPDTVQFALSAPLADIESIVAQSNLQNPNLKSYEYKLNGLEVERKLKFQSLLPYFNVKANVLSKDYYTMKGLGLNYLDNNYKWGVDFKMPLFLREGRGDYKKAQLKIKETNLELDNKRWQVANKIRYYFNEFTFLQQQIGTTKSMYSNYNALLHNEELKFSQGESTLFLVNSREVKVIELLQKQIELQAKFKKAQYATYWAAGLLN